MYENQTYVVVSLIDSHPIRNLHHTTLMVNKSSKIIKYMYKMYTFPQWNPF